MSSRIKPWIHCPCCWVPIEVPIGEEVGKHECQNPTCPLSTLKVRVKVCSSRKEAKEAQEKEGGVFLIGEIEMFLDISDKPVNFWGYYFCDEPMDRFRLLDGRPMEKLMQRDFVANWELGVVNRNEPKRAFTTFMVEYEKESGQVKQDEHGNPQLIPVSPQVKDSLLPTTTQYCIVCQMIREKANEYMKTNRAFVHPCLECNGKLVSLIFREWKDNHEELRLAVVDPTRSSRDLFNKMHHICWLGLLDMSFPIMVADIIIGVVFTGQTRLKGASLSDAEMKHRRGILDEIGVSEEDVVAKIENMPEISEREAKKLWNKLRDSARQLQMICASRYGQMGAVRESLLAGKLRNRVRATSILSKTKSRILSEMSHAALNELGIFFSFQRAVMLVREGGLWKAVACWVHKRQNRTDLPISLEVELTSDKEGMPSTNATAKIRAKLWPEINPDSYYYWVRANQETWYLLMVRRFEKDDRPRAKLNRFSQHLVREITLTLHRETLSLLSTHEQIENIRHIVHNLGGPGAALSSALAAFDAETYGKHLGEMTALSGDYGFLKQAINRLCLDVERSRRRIAFEVKKFEAGIDIEKQLKGRGKKTPIFDPTQSPVEGPSGLWDKTLWSFDMYGRDMSLREIELEQIANKHHLVNEHIRINEDALQIVLDNMVDNAVKYSYQKSKTTVRIVRDEIEGRACCVLSIGNYGNGILEGEIHKVWDRLYRGICSTTRRKQVSGSGLGMFIIKKVVEHYGGQVAIKSNFGGDINYRRGEGFYTIVQIALPLL